MNKAISYKKICMTLLVSVMASLVWAVPFLASAQGAAISSALAEVLWTIVNNVFGWIAGVAGVLLDTAVTRYVVGFGELYRTSGLGFSIDTLWSTVRDIFNLTFIFGLVYIGFKMIFNTSDRGARSMLVSLVIAALLVNFSLFITKFVIDFANIAAAQFAQAFSTGSGTYSVSEGFMNLFGLSGALRTLPEGAEFTFIFGMLFLYIIAAFVFAAGGLLLIIRFVVLNIYMVLSPVMFLGLVFPGLGSVSRKYWEGFLGRAFFAPAYILMLYFAHQILVNMQGVATNGNANLATAFQGGTQYQAAVTVIPFFIIIAGFLIASLVVAQKMGAEGASTAIAVGRRMSGRARKMTVGAAGYLPRKAINPAGAWTEKKLNNLQTKNFKNSNVIAGSLGAIARNNIADRAVRGTATAMVGAKLGTGTTNKAEAAYQQKILSRANQTEAENKRTESFSASLKKLEKTDGTDFTQTTKDLNTALDDLTKTIKGMTKDEKNNMSLNDLTNKSVAINLSDDDMKNLEASGNFSAAEVQRVKDARKQGFASIATHGSTLTTTDASGKITGFSNPSAGQVDPTTGAATTIVLDRRKSLAGKGTKEVGNLPVEIFKEKSMYEFITPAMLEERMRNGLSPEDIQPIREALDSHYGFGGLTPAEVAQQFPTMPGIEKNPWVKWEKGNSVYAAQFFNS